MYLMVIMIAVLTTCLLLVKMFIKDKTHDLSVKIGKFLEISITKHDKE